MKQFTKLLIILFTLTLCLTLCACNEPITPEQSLKNEVVSLFKNVEFDRMEETAGKEDGETTRTYYFNHKDFSFIVENYLVHSEGWGNLENTYFTSYYNEIYKFKQKDFEQIANKHGITLYEYNYGDTTEYRANLKDKQGILLSYDFGMLYDANIELTFYVDNYTQVKVVENFLNDFHELFEDYLPDRDSEYLNANLQLSVCRNNDFKPETSYRADLIYHDDVQLHDDADVDDVIDSFNNWTDHLYLDYVRQDLITDSSAIIDEDFKPSIINKLYINSSEFTSEKYPIEFFYNVEDDVYYTPVCFGTKLSYNGGVEDYLQREIIQKYNLENKYKINVLMDKTTYQLHNDKFVVTWKNKGEENEDMVFSKNGKILDIKTYKEFGPRYAGASYNRLISIDDFAMLCGLSIDEINTQQGIIYCSSMK